MTGTADRGRHHRKNQIGRAGRSGHPVSGTLPPPRLPGSHRRTADITLFVGQADARQHAFLGRHVGDAGRDAGTKVADGPFEQLHRAAPQRVADLPATAVYPPDRRADVPNTPRLSARCASRWSRLCRDGRWPVGRRWHWQHLRIAAETTRFGVPEVQRGVVSHPVV